MATTTRRETDTSRARSAWRDRLPWLWWVVVLVGAYHAASTLTASIIGSYESFRLLDLQVYRMGGEALLDGQPLYEARYHWDGLPFTYTPFAALVFVPLALLSPDAAPFVMVAVSIGVWLRTTVLLARELPQPRYGPVPAWLLWSVVGLSLWAVRSTLEYGQVNMLVIWLVVEDLFGLGRRRLGGVLLGIAIGIKLTPAYFVLLLLTTRQVRRVATTAAAAAGTVAVGLALQPDQAWHYWTAAAYDSSRVGDPAYVNNQSWSGLLARVVDGGSHPLWLLLSAVTTVVALAVATSLWRRDARLGALAVTATAGLLCSPISWSHHWVFWLPVLMVLATPMAGVDAPEPVALRWCRRAVLGLAAALAIPRVIFIAGDRGTDPVGLDAGPLWANAYVIAGVAFLAIAAAVAVTARRSAGPLVAGPEAALDAT